MSLNNGSGLPPLTCATAGSVDDGKSTLIGRLLHDAKALHTDQLAHLSEWNRRRGREGQDLALVTDGLRAEREGGITIDVAWRYFATAARRFILADSPGHVQYTRNMVTAMSRADLAVILVDARRGVAEQTRRHLFVTRLLGVRGVTIAVNKMDQVDFSLDVFSRIRDEIGGYLSTIDVPRAAPELTFVPLSALRGDNVVDASNAMPWYDGPTLLAHLERAPVDLARGEVGARLAVQCVIRSTAAGSPDFRGYAGRVASGAFRAGDDVRVLPADIPATIAAVETADGPVEEARAGASVVLRLTSEIDVGRGDVIVAAGARAPRVTQDLMADVAWMHKAETRLGAPYWLKAGTREVRAFVRSIDATYDIASGRETAATAPLGLNALGRVRLHTSEPVTIDAYADLRSTGSFLLIDPATGDTVAAGMAREPE